MAKLYLIRRNLDTFAGPMTLSEMKEAYKRMQFGLTDETSGHCGPWVQFDDLERIKKHYPEVARIVNEDMLAGWGVSDHSGRAIVEEKTKRLQAQPNKNFGLAVAFLVIAVIAFAAAVYMANSGKFSGKLKDPGEEPTPEAAQAFIDKKDLAGFQSFMEGNLEGIVLRATQVKTGESPWMLYLRAHAFQGQGEGTIKGVDPKLLRGVSAASTPSDCSLKTWRKRWRTSVKQWSQLAYERKLPRAHWGRLIAWDPHWIRRRDNKGWPQNLNYYVGCLTMADRALAEVSGDTSLVTTAADWDKFGLPKLRARLTWVLEMARDGASTQSASPNPQSPMALWNCYEAAKDVKALTACRDGQEGQADQWSLYNEERFGWNLVRVLSKERGTPAPEVLALIQQATNKLTKADYFTRFDYRAELKLAKALSKLTGPIEKVVEKTQGEFPDVRFGH